MHDKSTLRQIMRGRLRTLDEVTRQISSEQIAENVLRSCVRPDAAQTIALFGGLKSEPDFAASLLPALHAQGVRTCFFQIEDEALQARQVGSMDDLQRGQMNVWEPLRQCPPIDISALDIILVPGIAFTRDGARLGLGGGFYDRLLARPDCRAQRIAVAFDLQIVDHIPVEPHDQRVDQIITESGLIQTGVSD